MEIYEEKLLAASKLVDDQPDAAHGICLELMNEKPDDPRPAFIASLIYTKAEKYGLANHMVNRAIELGMNRSEAYNNLGMNLQAMHRPEEALPWFQKALKERPDDPTYLTNIAVCYGCMNKWKEGLSFTEKALKINPNHKAALGESGFQNLALGNWSKGFDHYRNLLGGKFRKELCFDNESKWDGTKGKTVVFYGEQGLGDEIMFSSMIPKASQDVTAILECDKRLEGLFKRSFPNVSVYGTRREKEIEWPNHHKIDANCALGDLPYFYKRHGFKEPKPYLIPDPERVRMWRALFDSYGKPVIGIAWTGGRFNTGSLSRNIGLEAFRGLIESKDAVFVSLQYKDATEEIEGTGLPVKQFKFATLTQDYDDTAAMVYALDEVISIHTAVTHLAGALGKNPTILVADRTTWVYASDEMPWYKCKLVRKKGTWEQTLSSLI